LTIVAIMASLAVACSSGGDVEPAPDLESTPDSTTPQAATAAVPAASTAPTNVASALTRNDDDPVNRIVYVTPDFEVFTVSPDGSDAVRITPDPELTPDDRYVWPLWSPSGESVLISRIQPPDQFGTRVALVMAAADGSDAEPVVVYEDDPATNGIGGSAPHYTEFSPDGRWLAAVVGTRNGLVLSVFDMADLGSRGTDLTAGAPIYYDWSYDSATLVVHHTGDLLTYENPIDGQLTQQAPNAPPTFSAPALSPVKDLVAAVFNLPGGPELWLIGSTGGFVTDVPAEAQFSWSSDGTKLALLRQTRNTLPIGLFDELAVIGISAEGEPSERILQFNRPMRSVWWAPNSESVALSSVELEDARITQWEVIDVESGDVTHVANIAHSADFEFVQTFHGQYERSHAIWAPDSSALVLTGWLQEPDESETAPTLTGPSDVWVVAADDVTPARTLGRGGIAFWSPR
jgi:hypothetical protein